MEAHVLSGITVLTATWQSRRGDIPAFTQVIKAGIDLATLKGCKADFT